MRGDEGGTESSFRDRVARPVAASVRGARTRRMGESNFLADVMGQKPGATRPALFRSDTSFRELRGKFEGGADAVRAVALGHAIGGPHCP
jgi:hypothetical protein